MRPFGWVFSSGGVYDIVEAEAEVTVGWKSGEGLDHVLRRQQRNDVRWLVTADDIRNGRKRCDDDAGHGCPC
jgi:hypothetical protein